ncbi:MAG: M56 family metallopeptidase [Oscillospiraceae bacterium]|nr:M56 family metallopeptidase [Oscillospiraceae bacterium]
MLEAVFSAVLRMSAGAAFAIPVVILLRLALKKVPKIWSYLLWVLVLVRLLCPVLPETVFSAVVKTDDLFLWVDNEMHYTPVFVGPEEVPSESMHADPEKGEEAKPSVSHEGGKEPMSWRHLSALLWLTGAAGVLLWGGMSMGKLKRKLRSAVLLEKGIYVADHIHTSFVTGLIRPRIYLPSDLAEEWMEAILLHERYHIRRLDPVVKLLYFVALTAHWFNPLVWIAYGLMTLDMEMSCDEAVAGQMTQEERKDYAQSLLCLATGHRSFPAPLSFGEGDTGKRIRNVLNYKKPAAWVTVLAVILCLAAALFILAEPASPVSGRLEYPGFSWGDSPEKVKSALKNMGSNRMILEESSWEESDTRETGGYAFMIGDLEMFGQRASSAVFRFVEYSWNPGQQMLEEIILYYPDGYDGVAADLEALKAEITAMCGEPVDEVVNRSGYPGYTGIQEVRSPVNPGITIWESEETALDILTEEEIQAMYDRMTRLYTELDTLDQLPTQEVYRATLETAVARITLRETFFSLMGMDRELSPEARAQGATDYVLTLSGQTYLGFLDVAENAKDP